MIHAAALCSSVVSVFNSPVKRAAGMHANTGKCRHTEYRSNCLKCVDQLVELYFMTFHPRFADVENVLQHDRQSNGETLEGGQNVDLKLPRHPRNINVYLSTSQRLSSLPVNIKRIILSFSRNVEPR